MRRSFRTRVRFFDFSGVARVVMPLTGGGVAMGSGVVADGGKVAKTRL